ncbi:MAG: hypothetical protein FWH53_02595, partial [Leptospirales bacterium]|nr:hypothetical protein [Leptospirales bacterium]
KDDRALSGGLAPAGYVADVTFSTTDITWDGVVGNTVNSEIASRVADPGYTDWVWIAKDNTISIQYVYNGTPGTEDLFTYTMISSNKLSLYSISTGTTITMDKD